jgi:CRP-like cAMP-binding protein
VTGFFTRGQIFGVEVDHYRATAEAVTDVTLIGYPRGRFEAFAIEQISPRPHPLSMALQNAEERIQLLVRKGAPARLAAFLLAIAIKDPRDGYSVQLPMSRADIADYIAVDVATVSRLFSRFVRQRLLIPGPDQGYRIGDVGQLEAVGGGVPLRAPRRSNPERGRLPAESRPPELPFRAPAPSRVSASRA